MYEFDFAIVDGTSSSKKIDSYLLYDDHFCLITSMEHPFASLKSVEVLEQEIKQIMDEHYEVVDGGYYDAENDSKIFDYIIEEGNIMNYIIYTY